LKRAFAALAFLLIAAAARAISAPKGALEDAQRFGFNRPQPVLRRAPSADSSRAFRAFNASGDGHWKLRFSPRTGLPASLMGGRDVPRSGPPDSVARAFLSAHADILGVDPSTLTLERQTKGNGHRHVLYRQSYKGIPLEFVAVKVHIDASGAVIGVHSTYEPNLSAPTTPAVTADAAGRSARADAGGGSVRGAPTLTIVPLETDGKNHLTWKMRVDSPTGGGWRYYVDAGTGQVLLRYSVREFSSGVITGNVYDVDPTSTPGPVARPFNHQYVYIGSGASQTTTAADGSFSSGVTGKITTSLQGPYVSVSEFRGPNAHYDDGNGVWNTAAAPVSSPHPYPNDALIANSIPLPSGAVEFLPVFNDFSVGAFDGGTSEGSGDISDDDRLMIADGAGNPIANYIGARGAFNGASVHGPSMTLTLKSNDSGQENGYDITVSSYLTLSNPDVDGGAGSTHKWISSDTWITQQQGSDVHGEIGLFYHLNLMHDYFTSDTDQSNAAPLNKPVVAMAHVGPNLGNAFYDPDYDDLTFGDINTLQPSDAFMDDATVPHHEYTHYMVDKIWSLQNYGQAGTLSEANADYWSATSLNDPHIGNYIAQFFTGIAPGCPLREIDDTTTCAVNNNLVYNFAMNTPAWTGEIHADSLYLSQAMWDVRRSEIGRLGSNTGRSCADGLVFQALLYFPESFSEIYEDMKTVASLSAVPNCAGVSATTLVGDITSAFNAHGLINFLGDAYEPNNGFETATDISTLGVISATIYPAADTDFYSFGAGPGLVNITMQLPVTGPSLYKDYQLFLYNASHVPVVNAQPPVNTCDNLDCNTTAPQVSISYNNPTGGLMYIQVIGGNLGDSVSAVNSSIPYTLSVSFPQNGALSSSRVGAKFDGDTISFTVNTSTFVSVQDWHFAYAQLRDQSNFTMPGTLTNVPGSFLNLVNSSNAYGQITGSVQLVSGFASRFPSVGTVALEVFAYDVTGSTSSMGVSNTLNLSDNVSSDLTAYNNLFNPLQGQKATVKYAVGSSGHVTIKLYTVTGRLVLILFDGDVPAGKGSVDWGGQNMSGNFVASGIYVVRAVGPGLNTTQKIAVIK
jgi:Zn-dependent metalloprotease